jgi:hypothetical protein
VIRREACRGRTRGPGQRRRARPSDRSGWSKNREVQRHGGERDRHCHAQQDQPSHRRPVCRFTHRIHHPKSDRRRNRNPEVVAPPQQRKRTNDSARSAGDLPQRMAERPGFEPGGQFYPTNRLAGGCLRPLGHLSVSWATLPTAVSSPTARGRPADRRPNSSTPCACGGGGRIRTHGPFGHPVSSGTPSTTRPPLPGGPDDREPGPERKAEMWGYDFSMRSSPPRYGRRGSGIRTLPSASW